MHIPTSQEGGGDPYWATEATYNVDEPIVMLAKNIRIVILPLAPFASKVTFQLKSAVISISEVTGCKKYQNSARMD